MVQVLIWTRPFIIPNVSVQDNSQLSRNYIYFGQFCTQDLSSVLLLCAKPGSSVPLYEARLKVKVLAHLTHLVQFKRTLVRLPT